MAGVPGLRVSQAQQRVLGDLAACRTAKLGGHVDACDACGELRVSYNSCGNRHCPKCQAQQRVKWLQNRCQDLLPVPYFHVVFTLPAELAPLALHNQREIYGALFAAAAATLKTIAADPQPSRCPDRLHRRVAHLGPDAGAPSPSPLRHPGWRVIAPTLRFLDLLPRRFLPPGPSPLTPLSRQDARRAPATLSLPVVSTSTALWLSWQISLASERSADQLRRQAVGGVLPSHPSEDPSRCSSTWLATPIVSLSQTARITAADSDSVSFRYQRLCPWPPSPGAETRYHGVSASLSAARLARPLRPYPPLRLSRQSCT